VVKNFRPNESWKVCNNDDHKAEVPLFEWEKEGCSAFWKTRTLGWFSQRQPQPEDNWHRKEHGKVGLLLFWVYYSLISAFFEIRPISYWLEERPDFKAVSILTDLNAVRLAMIAVSNTLACAPTEDKAGVTLECLPKALKIFTKMGRNMDMLVRNNNQRYK